MDQIQYMSSEDPQILGTSTLISLATAAYFQRFADGAFRDEFVDRLQGGMVAVAVGDSDFYATAIGGCDDLIGFLRGAAKRFLHVDALRTGVDGRQGHFEVLVRVSWADRDHVGLDRLEHFAVVGKTCGRMQPRGGGGESRRVRIRNSDDLRLGNF